MDLIIQILRVALVTCLGTIALVVILYLGLIVLSRVKRPYHGRLEKLVYWAVFFDRVHTHIYYKPPSKEKLAEIEQEKFDRKVNPLLKRLSDLNNSYWQSTSYKLSEVGPPVNQRLIELLEKSENPVSIRAGITLGRVRNRETIPALLDLCKHENLWVRRGSIIALGRIGDSSVLSSLIDLLDDPSPQIRNDVALALMKLRDPLAVPELAKALRESEGDFEFAGIALGSFGVVALDQLVDAIAANYCHKSMDDAIKSIGIPAVTPLLELLENPGTEKKAASKVAYLLGVIGDPSAVEGLEMAMTNGESDLIEECTWALKMIKHSAT